jgi:hypothetical protein
VHGGLRNVQGAEFLSDQPCNLSVLARAARIGSADDQYPGDGAIQIHAQTFTGFVFEVGDCAIQRGGVVRGSG